MVVGIITASGGHTLREVALAMRGQNVSFQVVTDRPCAAETQSERLGIPVRRIEIAGRDDIACREDFSRAASRHLEEHGAKVVFLLFNRIVSPHLHKRLPTLNLHPSLLPAFPGMHAIDEARRARVRFIGTTLHAVTEDIDGGPVIAQASAPIDPTWSTERLTDMSFIQRVALMLVGIVLSRSDQVCIDPSSGAVTVSPNLPHDARCNPALVDAGLRSHVQAIELARNVRVIA